MVALCCHTSHGVTERWQAGRRIPGPAPHPSRHVPSTAARAQAQTRRTRQATATMATVAMDGAVPSISLHDDDDGDGAIDARHDQGTGVATAGQLELDLGGELLCAEGHAASTRGASARGSSHNLNTTQYHSIPIAKR